ncbi:MAG: recombinase family protein [Velocimicrobium sp.]
MDKKILDIIQNLPSYVDLSQSHSNGFKVGAQYVRVSTEDQVELSPITQLKLGLEFANAHHILVPREYIFIEHGGVSGRNVKNRHEFKRMIGLAKSNVHLFDCILVWRFSRFARNQEESIVYKSLLSKNKIDVISITEPIDDSPFGKLNERIIEWMDEYYSIRLSDEVLRGMKENARRGAYQSNPPIGYDYVGNKNPPCINKSEQEIIQRIFHTFLDGYSVTQIARLLNESGYRSKRGSLFESRTIQYILTNPFYIGKVRWNYFNRSTHSYNKDSDVIIADGIHTPIITMDIWNAVQEQVQRKKRPFKKRDLSICKHWLSGVLECSCCHKSLAFCSMNRSGYTYQQFKCWGYTKGMCSISNSIRVDRAEEYVLSALKQLCKTNRPYHFNVNSAPATNNELEHLNSQLKRLSLQETRYTDSYANGIDSIDEYREHKMSIQKERTKLNKQIDTLSNTKFDVPSATDQTLTSITSIYPILMANTTDFVQKGNAIRSILARIVFDKESFTFQFYFYLTQ